MFNLYHYLCHSSLFSDFTIGEDGLRELSAICHYQIVADYKGTKYEIAVALKLIEMKKGK